MTGIFETKHALLFPTRPVGHGIIDPVAFFIALFGAPILTTAATFWLVIPVFALVIGGPLYLVLGTPALLWHLRRDAVDASSVALLALLVFLAGLVIMGLLSVLTGNHGVLNIVLYLGPFGAIFAPLWGGVFARIYLKLRRDVYAPRRS